MSRTWSIAEHSADGAVHHFVLRPLRAGVTDMCDLMVDERTGLFAALKWIVDTHELGGYGLGVAELGLLEVHVVVGDGQGTVQFNFRTGEVAPKQVAA